MSKSFHEWIGEGEEIYRSLVEEFRRTEQQVTELEQLLVAKVNEVNELARVIGKPAIGSPLPRRIEEADLIDPPGATHTGTQGAASSSANIARALTGNVAVKLL